MKSNPMSWLVFVAAYITDIYLVFFYKWSEKTLAYYILLALVLFFPIFMLVIWILSSIEALQKRGVSKGKIIATGVCYVAVAVLVGIGGFLLYREVTIGAPLRRADELFAAGKYDEAVEAYRKVERERDVDCADKIAGAYIAEVEALLAQSNVEGAAAALSDRMGEYGAVRRCAAELVRENAELREALFAPGSSVPMGSEPNDVTPQRQCDWYILEQKDDCIFVIAPAFCQPQRQVYRGGTRSGYHFGGKDTLGWEDSALREYLNEGESSVYRRMFSDAERAAIRLTTIENTIHQNNEVVRGNDTQDYMFVLSRDEVERYKQEQRNVDLWMSKYRVHETWWIRTPATLEEVQDWDDDKTECNEYGLLAAFYHEDEPYYVNKKNSDSNVVPAMWVDIELLLKAWSEEA